MSGTVNIFTIFIILGKLHFQLPIQETSKDFVLNEILSIL